MAFEIDYNGSTLKSGLDKLNTKIAAAVLMYAATKAADIEAKMKLNRPWTDRTNMAKTTLNAKVSQPNPETIRITCAHGVDYGIWLELANEKNYAIIGPTIKHESPNVMRDLNKLMNKLG